MVIKHNRKLFSNLRPENWSNLLIVAVLSFFLTQYVFTIKTGNFPTVYGQDFLAFWTIGKIADEKGFSEIYGLNNFRDYQIQEFVSLGFHLDLNDTTFSPIITLIFPIFVLPFQLLAKLPSVTGYWIWTIISTVLLVWYLLFFLQKIKQGTSTCSRGFKILLLIFFSYPVLNHLLVGQVNFFLVICAGEFIRSSLEKKPVMAGLWLGGLLLKPQILILVIPLLLILRYWKVLLGFIVSTCAALSISLALSGYAGIAGMIKGWVGWAAINSTNAPQYMINWRMIGVNLNDFVNTSLGWGVTGLGITLTIFALVILTKHRYPYGSPSWIVSMMGVFCATLVATWHSHSSMAMVLIPFLLYASLSNLLHYKFAYLWTCLPLAVMTATIMLKLIFVLIGIKTFNYFLDLLTTFSVFILLLILLGSIVIGVNRTGLQG